MATLAEQQELSAALHCRPGQGIPPFLALHIFGNAPENTYSTAHQTRILATALGEAGVRCDVIGTANKQHIAHDNDGDVVYLTRLQWDIDRIGRDYPDVTLSATKEMMV